MGVCLPFSRWKSLPFLTAATGTTCSPSTSSTAQLLFRRTMISFCRKWKKLISATSGNRPTHKRGWSRTVVTFARKTTGSSPVSPQRVSGLTALCIGEKQRFITLSEARGRVLVTLRFLWKKLPQHRGFFYHFANLNTGERLWDSEVSSVDTAILLCGILTCRHTFRIPKSDNWRARYLTGWTGLGYRRTRLLLPHGWTPEIGFLPYRWDDYSELMMMYLLGLGSNSHPLPKETWDAWKRSTFEYDGLRYIGSFAPLFVHQYSQAWFDFRGKRDNMQITFRIQSLPPMFIAASVWNSENSFPSTAMTCGALRLQIR